jgi:hypothetical protein
MTDKAKSQKPSSPDKNLASFTLADRTSVRTTFRLSKETIKDLSWLARNHGVTFKEVFDELCTDYLLRYPPERHIRKDGPNSEPQEIVVNPPMLHFLADLSEEEISGALKDSIRRTYVISKGALKILQKVSEEYGIPRDALVNSSLGMMRSYYEYNVEKREEREMALELILKFQKSTVKLQDELNDLFEGDDATYTRFSHIVVLIKNLTSALECNLEKGTPIDPDNLSQSG